MASIVMASIVMAYTVMALMNKMTYVVMAYAVTAYIVMTSIVMAYIVMAYIVMARMNKMTRAEIVSSISGIFSISFSAFFISVVLPSLQISGMVQSFGTCCVTLTVTAQLLHSHCTVTAQLTAQPLQHSLHSRHTAAAQLRHSGYTAGAKSLRCVTLRTAFRSSSSIFITWTQLSTSALWSDTFFSPPVGSAHCFLRVASMINLP